MTSQPPPASVAVLISGAGTIMAALIDAARDPAFGARIGVVVADHADIAGLEIARAAGIPTAVVDLADFPSRAAWNDGLIAALDAFSPDLVVCAGFMKILGPAVVEHFPNRIVNTHPALLPSFPGAHAVRDALAHGVRITGCTVHLIDVGVDTGPIVAQEAVAVGENDTEEMLHGRIKDVERRLVVDTVGTMVREGWALDGRSVRLGAATKGTA